MDRKSVKFRTTLSFTSSLEMLDGQHHASATLTPGKTRYPLCRGLGWPQGRSGRVRKISPQKRVRSPDRTARSKSLHRMPKEGNLAAVSCFAAGRDWHWEVGAIIRFVILCFLLLVTRKLRAVVLWVDLNRVLPVVAGWGLSAVMQLLRCSFVWMIYQS